jgi:hypothetical protein
VDVSQLISRVGVSIHMNDTFTKSQNSTTAGAGPGIVDPGHARVNEVNGREANQQQRIANGVSSAKFKFATDGQF